MDQDNPGTEMEITLIRRTKSIAEDPAAGQRKRDRESGRLKAQEHAPEMLMMIVGIARDSNEETKNRFAAAKYVCDRAWGTPKAEQNEDPAITNKTILDVLASVSIDMKNNPPALSDSTNHAMIPVNGIIEGIAYVEDGSVDSEGVERSFGVLSGDGEVGES